MKKILSITSIALLSISSLLACDICGGGVGSYYVGLLPQFNKKLIGIRYQFNQLHTNLDIQGQQTALSNKEQYQTMDVWGAWNIGSKWRIMASLPYSFIQKTNINSNQINKKNGLSDITLTGYYNIFQKSNLYNQILWFGLGVKLPSGQYNNLETTNNSPNIFQLGSGSTDILAQINYDINIDNWGLNTTANYKLNTANKDQYRYGNKLTANLSLYRRIALANTISLIPNMGLIFENQQKDKTMRYTVDQTGGNILQGTVGLEANYNKIAVGASFQNPLKQNLASNRIKLNNKFMVHLSYTF